MMNELSVRLMNAARLESVVRITDQEAAVIAGYIVGRDWLAESNGRYREALVAISNCRDREHARKLANTALGYDK